MKAILFLLSVLIVIVCSVFFTKSRLKNGVFLLVLVTFATNSCKSREQILAEACLREHLKCPSTLKVVEFSIEERAAHIDCDTMFHVSRVNGKKFSPQTYYHTIKSVTIDSICTITRNYPAYTYCSVKYDAQNLMGAIVREKASVVIENGTAIMFDSWFQQYYYQTETNSWKESRTITDLNRDCCSNINAIYINYWLRQYDIQKLIWE